MPDDVDTSALAFESRRLQDMQRIERRKIRLELEKLRHAEAIDQQKIALDRTRCEREGYFFHRNGAACITAAVAFAAALFTGYFGYRSNEVMIAQQKIASDQNAERDKLAEKERERTWRLEALKLVTANPELVRSGSKDERTQLRDMMLVTFPKDIVATVFADLERQAVAADDKTGRAIWLEGQKQAEAQQASALSVGASPVVAEAVKQIANLTGAGRRDASDRLIGLYQQDKAGVVKALVDSLKPQTDAGSYRHNLYVLVTLARIAHGWEGTEDQVRTIKAIPTTQDDNYADKTFQRWADAAARNAGRR